LLDHAGNIFAEQAKIRPEIEYAKYRALVDAAPRTVNADFEKGNEGIQKAATTQEFQTCEFMNKLMTIIKVKLTLFAALCGLLFHAVAAATPDDSSVLPFRPTPSASVAEPRQK